MKEKIEKLEAIIRLLELAKFDNISIAKMMEINKIIQDYSKVVFDMKKDMEAKEQGEKKVK